MAAAAIIASVAIAVGGWLVSQAQARRATRRNMRIEYLLDAYRRLDRASNRVLTPETSRELEAALGDIMLLGSASQVDLAVEFVRKFASERSADSQPLLLELRNSLRQELLLSQLPSSAYISLRVDAERARDDTALRSDRSAGRGGVGRDEARKAAAAARRPAAR
jgi:hypothetical protein